MKVRHIRARRFKRAQTTVRNQWGPRCPDFDPYCVVCLAHKFLAAHHHAPTFDQVSPHRVSSPAYV